MRRRNLGPEPDMERNLKQHVAETIYEGRERLQLTQQELAKRAGINKGQLSRIEAGDQAARPETLMRLAEALDIPIESLFPSDKPSWHYTHGEKPDQLVPVFEHVAFSAVLVTAYRPTYYTLTSPKRGEYRRRHGLFSDYIEKWWVGLRDDIKREKVKRFAPAIRMEYRIHPESWYVTMADNRMDLLEGELKAAKTAETWAYVTIQDEVWAAIERGIQPYLRGMSWEAVSVCDENFVYVTNDDHTLDFCWHSSTSAAIRSIIEQYVSIEYKSFSLKPIETLDQWEETLSAMNRETIRRIEAVARRKRG